MDFGVRLRRLSEMKVGLAGCLVIALSLWQIARALKLV